MEGRPDATEPLGLCRDLDRLAGARVGVVGDLVADRYVSGQSDRVSREAPVLVLQYERDWLRPGGAANVAVNIAALGATACVVGLIGDDEDGRRLVQAFREAAGPGSVRCEHIVTAPGRETITKTRFLAGARLTSRQQVLRLDRQPAGPPQPEMIRQLADGVARADREVDAWIISDYGYGSFDEQLRDRFREIAREKPVVADSRFAVHLFRGMSIIKPNEEEAEAAARKLGIDCCDPPEMAIALAEKLQAGAALITLGNKGMALASGGESVHIPAVGTEEIVDLTGAGDSVAATLATALAGGVGIEAACGLANHAGAIVVMKEGAATASPEELRASIAASEGTIEG